MIALHVGKGVGVGIVFDVDLASVHRHGFQKVSFLRAVFDHLVIAIRHTFIGRSDAAVLHVGHDETGNFVIGAVEGMILGYHDGVRNLLCQTLVVIPAIEFISDKLVLRHQVILCVGRAVHTDCRFGIRREGILSVRHKLVFNCVAVIVDRGSMGLIAPVGNGQRF